MARAETVNDDPVFLDMMADVVLRTLRRHERGRPLPLWRNDAMTRASWLSVVLCLTVLPACQGARAHRRTVQCARRPRRRRRIRSIP